MARPEGAVLARHDIDVEIAPDLTVSGNISGELPRAERSADAGTFDQAPVLRITDLAHAHIDSSSTGTTRRGPLDSDAHGEGFALATPPTVAARERFAAWSRRYIAGLVAIDAVVGLAAVFVPLQFSNNFRGELPLVAALTALGMLLWPLAVAISRGYQRGGVGVGTNELRSVMHAGVALVVAGAFPAGLLQQQSFLKLIVVAVPLALTLSLVGRFAARKLLHGRQAAGQSMRHVVVVGNTSSARELGERLARETHCGMKVVGVCLPAAEVGRAVGLGCRCSAASSDVAEVLARTGATRVAVTSDDATRNGYLRKLAWSLEGTGVEMLVDPGLVEVAGPRMHIRPLMGFPLLHVEEPHFTGAAGWSSVPQTWLLTTSACS